MLHDLLGVAILLLALTMAVLIEHHDRHRPLPATHVLTLIIIVVIVGMTGIQVLFD